jgi:Leucine-rich repeat (LRR) protein
VRQGDTLSDDSQSPDSSPLLDVDRRAAEWVLSVGGNIVFTTGADRALAVSARGPLPAGPFMLKNVHISQCPQVTDDGLTNLRGCLQLSSISAWNTQITDGGLAVLTDNRRVPFRNLTRIFADRTRITNDGLRLLAGSDQINRLSLIRTDVSDLKLITEQFPSIETLAIGGTGVPADMLAHLEELPLLRGLDVSDSQLQNGGTEHVRVIKALEKLIIWDVSAEFNPDVLSGLSKLQMLALTGTDETDLNELFWQSIDDHRQLEGLILNNSTTSRLLSQMPTLPALRYLSLSGTTVSGEAITKAIGLQRQLERLVVNHTHLTEVDIK